MLFYFLRSLVATAISKRWKLKKVGKKSFKQVDIYKNWAWDIKKGAA
jgi:hypothetical protein